MISLWFPGAPVEVANNTRLRMFPKALTTGPTVECIVGSDDARIIFEVKKAALEILPQSYFASQLRLKVGTTTTIELEEEHPRFFPIIFSHLNHLLSGSLNLYPPNNGLSDEEKEELTRLVDYLGVCKPVSSLLQLCKGIQPLPFVFKADGLFRERGGPITVNWFGGDTLVCIATGGYALIRLSMVPTQEPWPRSLVADKVQYVILKGQEHAKKRPRLSELVIMQDELSEDDLAPHQFYPYPIDFKETFFIPSQAIKVVLDGKVVVCEGVYNVCTNSIRIDALDTEWATWFFLSIEMKQN